MAEQEVEVDLARARLVSAGVVGDLHVADPIEVGRHGARQVSLHDLHVVDVVLEEDVGVADPFGDAPGLGAAVNVEARDVARVDRLDQQRDVVLGQNARRVAEIPHQRRFDKLRLHAFRR